MKSYVRLYFGRDNKPFGIPEVHIWELVRAFECWGWAYRCKTLQAFKKRMKGEILHY